MVGCLICNIKETCFLGFFSGIVNNEEALEVNCGFEAGLFDPHFFSEQTTHGRNKLDGLVCPRPGSFSMLSDELKLPLENQSCVLC